MSGQLQYPLWFIQVTQLGQQICVVFRNSGIVLIICHGKTKGLRIARNILAPLSIENTSKNLVEKGIFSLWLLMPQTIEI